MESGHRNHQISKKKVNYLEFFSQYFIEEYFLDLQFQLANQGINLSSAAAFRKQGDWYRWHLLFCNYLGLKR